mmetsp:Transcript_17664/g.39784  ORF Transcript_17664/g.39784 Transcript_17664/m.39784 type:complete len:153 (+) Transcript_17664:289-747(+)
MVVSDDSEPCKARALRCPLLRFRGRTGANSSLSEALVESSLLAFKRSSLMREDMGGLESSGVLILLLSAEASCRRGCSPTVSGACCHSLKKSVIKTVSAGGVGEGEDSFGKDTVDGAVDGAGDAGAGSGVGAGQLGGLGVRAALGRDGARKY